VGPRASLDYVEKLKFLLPPGLELRHLGRPAHSQSLYRLGYPGECSVSEHPEYLEIIMYIKFCTDVEDVYIDITLLYRYGNFRIAQVGIHN
jgi:hypothetical protein